MVYLYKLAMGVLGLRDLFLYGEDVVHFVRLGVNV